MALPLEASKNWPSKTAVCAVEGVVEREDFPDDVEHAVCERGAHLIEFLQEALEDSSLDDRLTLLGVARHKVENVAITLLPDAVDSSQPLFEARGIPGQVVVD